MPAATDGPLGAPATASAPRSMQATNVSTISGSNCVPEQARSSVTASARVSAFR